MARLIFSPFGVYVVCAAFSFTEYEAQHWVRYPQDGKLFDIRVFPCDTEQYAQELLSILA